MKIKAISWTVASVMTLQNIAIAQSSRIDGIGETQVLAAKKEMAVLRQDILKLDQALADTTIAIQQHQENGSYAAAASVGMAALGLGLAALSMTVAKVGGDSGVGGLISLAGLGVAAVKTSSSLAFRLVSEVQKGSGDAKEASDALTKARQEIQATRATNPQMNSEAKASLNKLDRSLAAIEDSLADYKSSENLNDKLQLTSMLGQAAGAAITFYVLASVSSGGGMNKAGALLGPALMTVGNISAVVSALTPSKVDAVLAEIEKTRSSLALALSQLQD